MAKAVFDPKAANIWTARIIPLILIGLVGYVSWVFIGSVCVNYLLKADAPHHIPRRGTAVTLIVIYCILLSLIALAYFRLLYVVSTNPGYVPRGPRWYIQKEQSSRQRSRTRKRLREPEALREKANGIDVLGNTNNSDYAYLDGPPITETGEPEEETSNLRSFYTKDIFTCEGDGRPVWCSTCLNFKPDRAHHCREVGRCVRKMDHFCPWVGGVVSETSFKFFVQFVFWAAIYCTFTLTVMAIYVAESRRETPELNVHWIVTLACGALFGLFTLGMTLSSMQFVFLNTTTIENLSRRTKVWSLAIFMPPSSTYPSPPPFNTLTYPLGYVYPNQDDSIPQPTRPPQLPKTFAILHSKPGENIWDLGYWRNFQAVMGETWYDWLLPINYSPCCKHDKVSSHFEMGPVVNHIRERAGIHLPYDMGKPARKRRKKRRSRQVEPGDERAGKRSRRKGMRETDSAMVDTGGGETIVRE